MKILKFTAVSILSVVLVVSPMTEVNRKAKLYFASSSEIITRNEEDVPIVP